VKTVSAERHEIAPDGRSLKINEIDVAKKRQYDMLIVAICQQSHKKEQEAHWPPALFSGLN